MAAYHFEGQFRSVPSQDHRGFSQRAQRNQIISHAVSERQRREAKRVREKNAIAIQGFARKLIAQKRLTRLAAEELAKTNAQIATTNTRAELESLLLKYIRLTVVAFFESTHRDVQVIVKAAQLIESRKRMILEFRERNPSTWNPALNSLLVTLVKTARYVSSDFKWTFTSEVALGLKSLVDVIHVFSSPSPMSVAVSSVPASLQSWLSFVVGALECILPWGYFEMTVNLLTLQSEVERGIPSFSSVGWELLCGPLFLLTRDLAVPEKRIISTSLRSLIGRYFAAEVLVNSKCESLLRDCTQQKIGDVFTRGCAAEVSSVSLFEVMCSEMPAALTLIACQAADPDEWREFIVSLIGCLAAVAPHFVRESKSGYWLLKLLYHYMVAAHIPENFEESWKPWKSRPLPDPSFSSASQGVRKRKVERKWRKKERRSFLKKQRAERRRFSYRHDSRSSSSDSDESGDERMDASDDGEEKFPVSSFTVAGMKEPFWTKHHTRIAVGLSNLFSRTVIVETVLNDANLWASDEECMTAFGWVTYELLELYAWRMSPLKAMNKLPLLDQGSRVAIILEKSYDLALTMKKGDEGLSLFGGSERMMSEPIWEAVKRGASLSREDTLRFVPVVVAAGALNSFALRNLLKLELPEDPVKNDPETLKAAIFFSRRFLEMLDGFSALSVGIIKILYPANSVLTGWSKRPSSRLGASARDRSSSGVSAFIQRQWTWAYRASVTVVRSAYDNGWRLGFVSNENFWVDMAQDEKLPFHSMNFDPSKFHELAFFGDEPEEATDEEMHAESRFDFLLAYLPKSSDVQGPKGSHVPIEASAFTTLLNVPFLIPFMVRVQAFVAMISRNRITYQGDMAAAGIGNFEISAKRDRLYDDAFMALSSDADFDAADAIRRRWKVTMYNQVGGLEAGIDGGGIFREFLMELLKSAVNPNRGLFQHTVLNTLYPNPKAGMLVEYDKQQFYFVGRMLGKALYENLLVDVAFAPFFLAQLMAVPYVPHLEDLRDLDPILHKNLEALTVISDSEELEQLNLDFSIVDSSMGHPMVIGLGPQEIQHQPVTLKNRLKYVQEYVKYKLVDEIMAPVRCVRAGFQEVIRESWLSLFRAPMELQLVLCGDQGPVELGDMEKNTLYSGGYTAEHPTIRTFWKVVHSFDGKDKQALLKFVTSCSRPPVLGFSELNPRFCIQQGGAEDRLPTASTCMNLLKLPDYSSAEVMREKLLYAINSSAGFELS